MRGSLIGAVLLFSAPAFSETVWFAECQSRGGSHPSAAWTSYEYATKAEAKRKAEEHNRQNPGHAAKVRLADNCNSGLTLATGSR
jgi:hypothetical protein